MLSAIAIVLVVIIALAWLRFGFWNGFLHMICVLVAGALAFAFWEPVSLFFLGMDQQWLRDAAWGLGLALPFFVILLVIRLACDKIIPSNVHFDSVGNMIGGGVCGFVSGTISVGILVISAGNLRVETEFMGFQPVQYEQGSLVHRDSLLFPVDRITAGVYSTLSNGSFLPADGETMAKWRPDAALMGPLMRTNFEDGSSMNTIRADAFTVSGRYTYTDKDPKKLTTDAVDLIDTGAPNRVHNMTYLDGSKPAGGTVEGYIVDFKAGAKEKTGRIVVGPAQMQLLVQKDPSDPTSTMMIQPMAVISQASGDKANLGRWRYDAPKVFIASASGRNDAPMAFEFLVPQGAQPLGLYVKGTRVDVSEMKGRKFESQAARDEAVRSGTIMAGGGDPSKLIKTRMREYNTTKSQEPFINIAQAVPFRITLQKDNNKGLEYNDANEITGGGLGKFSANDLKSTQGMDPKLSLRRFYQPDDVVTVAVRMDKGNDVFGFLSDAASGVDPNKAPMLYDHNGTPYSALGYVYRVKSETWIYFNPQAPLKSQTDQELPQLSRSNPDQELYLIFRVSRNVKIQYFGLGDEILAEFKPQMQTAPVGGR